MTITIESKDWLAQARDGSEDEELNVRTRNDAALAEHVARASKTAYELGRDYEDTGNRDAAIQNYVEAKHIGQFITRLYDADSSYLASW